MATALRTKSNALRLMDAPLLGWALLISTTVLTVALPASVVALALLLADRNFGSSFYGADSGSNATLVQHLFRSAVHSAECALFLPAVGIIIGMIPCRPHKPILIRACTLVSMLGVAMFGPVVLWRHLRSSSLSASAVNCFGVVLLSAMLLVGSEGPLRL